MNKSIQEHSAVFLLTALLLAACTGNNESPADNVSESNIKIARDVYSYFNDHDWEGMAGLYSDPAEFKDPSLGPTPVTQTHAEIIAKYTELQSMFPDVKDEIVAVYPSGSNHVIVEFVSSGTAPDGQRWTLPICTIFTIENGLITKDYTYYDNSMGGE